MTNRERAMNILHFKHADRMPAVHFGYWNELLYEWAEQGHISQDLARGWRDGNECDHELDEIIGWDFNWANRFTSIDLKINPLFEEKVLEVLPDGCRRMQTKYGVIERLKPGVCSIPSEDDYLLQEILFNPHTSEQLEKIQQQLSNLQEIVNNRDSEEMKKYLDKVRDNLK